MTLEVIYNRILSSLTEIEDRIIPVELIEQFTIEQLASELSAISMDVLAAEARFIKLIPTSFDIDIIESVNGIIKSLVASGKENEITLLITNLKKLTRNPSSKFSLKIDQSEIYIPNPLADETISLLIDKLEAASRKVAKKSRMNYTKIKIKTMADFANQSVKSVLQPYPSLFNRQQVNLMTALIFVGTSHLPSIDEYVLNPKLKDYLKVMDRDLLEESGIKKKKSKPRFFKYHDMLAKRIKEINPVEQISVRDLVINALRR